MTTHCKIRRNNLLLGKLFPRANVNRTCKLNLFQRDLYQMHSTLLRRHTRFSEMVYYALEHNRWGDGNTMFEPITSLN